MKGHKLKPSTRPILPTAKKAKLFSICGSRLIGNSFLCWEMDVFIGGGGGGRVGGSIAGASLHIHENTAPLNYRYVRAPETRWSVEP